MSDAIRRRGENISSFDVEQVVRQHPAVIDCAAIGVPAAHGDEEVLIVVEVLEPARLEPAELRVWLEPRLPRFMLPHFIRITGALPRNETSQRVQKFRLRADGVTPETWEHPAREEKGQRARQPS
jgi:crotonobetaine/carnitine-CoA ligase